MPSAGPTWNAEELLEIISPATGTFCCAGWTTKNRRCTKPIARHNRWAAEAILASLPQTSRNEVRLRTELRKLAGLALCRGYHQGQINRMTAEWFRTVVEAVEAEETSAQGQSESEGLEEEIQRLQRELEELRRRQEEQKRRENERRREEERQEEEAQRRAGQEDRQNRERQEAEARRREEEDARQREEETRQREETRRQEEQRREEARQQQQEARRQREARQRAEAQARIERERSQRERISREWSESWARYERDWANMQRLDTSTLDEDIRESVPWPVKSGRWQDVNEANIRAFFCRAPDDAAENPRRFLLVLRRQTLRWHEDKLRQFFPRVAGDAECRRLANVIIQMLNGLKGSLASS